MGTIVWKWSESFVLLYLPSAKGKKKEGKERQNASAKQGKQDGGESIIIRYSVLLKRPCPQCNFETRMHSRHRESLANHFPKHHRAFKTRQKEQQHHHHHRPITGISSKNGSSSFTLALSLRFSYLHQACNYLCCAIITPPYLVAK